MSNNVLNRKGIPNIHAIGHSSSYAIGMKRKTWIQVFSYKVWRFIIRSTGDAMKAKGLVESPHRLTLRQKRMEKWNTADLYILVCIYRNLFKIFSCSLRLNWQIEVNVIFSDVVMIEIFSRYKLCSQVQNLNQLFPNTRLMFVFTYSSHCYYW